MEASVPAPTIVFISRPVMRPKYIGFLFHGHGPFTVWSAPLTSEDCRDSVLFVGSKLHRGHIHTVLSYRDFTFVLSHVFSWLSRKIGFMVKSILQEHIYKDVHELSSYWFSKKAKPASVPSSVSCTELIHKAGDLVLTLIFDLIGWCSTVLSPAHQLRLSSHLTHWLCQISHPLDSTTSVDFITTFLQYAAVPALSCVCTSLLSFILCSLSF